jgi:chromosome segregation ATPase
MTKITPLVTAVQTALAASQVRPMMGGRGGGAQATPSELQTAITALNATIADAAATPDDLKTKLKAVRDAKAKALDDLKKAQKALVDILTPKEEAVLVAQGILE